MQALYQFLLPVHIIAGAISLIVFWIPIFTKKGGKAHIRVGKLYVFTMWVVVLTAAFLCIINAMTGRPQSAAFLGFLTILSSYPLWYGIVILKHKKHIPDHILHIRKALNVLLLLGGIGLISWGATLGFKDGSTLFLIFGILGLLSFPNVIRSSENTRAHSNWLLEHINGMVITGIAAYTAFFAFGGREIMGELFSGSLMAIPWSAPTVLGIIAMRFMRAKYVPK